MRNNFRIHARDASRNMVVFVTHFSISGDGRPPPIDLIFFFYLLLTYLVASSLSNSYLQKNPATKNLLDWPHSIQEPVRLS